MSKLGIRLNVEIVEADAKTGKVINRQNFHNLIPLVGRNLVRDLLGGLLVAPTHIALGTGTAAAADADSQLQSEVYRDLVTRRISGSSQIVFQLYVPTTGANGNTISEAGLFFQQGPVNTLVARSTNFTPIVKTSASTITISWTISIQSS